MPRTSQIDPDVEAALKAALSKKAEELIVLDLRGLSDVTDCFVICHGGSGRQVQTICDSIEEALRTLGRRPKGIEGYTRAEWILMDYLDFVVHIFTAERREYYGLERLWSDAPRVPFKKPGRGARRARTAQPPADATGAGAASD